MYKIFNFFNHPRTALIIILLFFLGFFLTEGFTYGFGSNFLSFGPAKDENNNYTKFMGINVDTWKKVSLVYSIIFVSTILQSYYFNVVGTNIHAYVWNSAVELVPFPKFWTYLVLLFDPLVRIITYVI